MQPEMTISYDVARASAISNEIEVLSLPSGSRKRLLQNVGRILLKRDRDNIRQQRTFSGKAMKKRQYGKARVLSRMGKDLKFFANPKRVRLTWPNRAIARLASRHQFGIPEIFNSIKMLNIHGTPDYQQPASKKQAKALLQEGFTISSGKRYQSGVKKGNSRRKKPSQKWITENLKMGQAALVIRKLRKEERPSKRWTIKVPERPFLGVPGGDAADILSTEIQREQQRRSGNSRP